MRWGGLRPGLGLSQLEAVGITVLVNEIAEVEDPKTGQILEVLGYDDVSSQPPPDFDALHAMLDPNAAALTLSHSPDAFAMTQGGPSLMLCGHTHGGQVRLPFVGATIMPVKYNCALCAALKWRCLILSRQVTCEGLMSKILKGTLACDPRGLMFEACAAVSKSCLPFMRPAPRIIR